MLGKNSAHKSAKKRFLYSHEYRDQKMGGKMRETIFPETNEWFEQKCWEKNRRQKMHKTSFYIHTNIVTKKWGKRKRETIFPETHEWFEQK